MTKPLHRSDLKLAGCDCVLLSRVRQDLGRSGRNPKSGHRDQGRPRDLGGGLLERLLTELARHTKAIQEALSTQISTIDDKYVDLPARVSHLETAVFAPKPR